MHTGESASACASVSVGACECESDISQACVYISAKWESYQFVITKITTAYIGLQVDKYVI